MSFETLKARLIGSLDIIPPSLAPNLINDALFDIYDSHSWSFLKKEDFIRTPDLIYQGTASVAKYSNQVTLDSTASAIITALSINDIPLTERQFRTFSTQITGRAFLYNITNVDASVPTAVVLTIDPYFLDSDNSAINYQILKAYYNPPPIIQNNQPVIDFNNWEYVISMKWQRQIILDNTLDELNKYDPARLMVDEPHHLVAHPPDSNGDPLFELYPAPRFERVYKVLYNRKGIQIDSNDNSEKILINEEDTIPKILTEEFVLTRAKYRAYEWAMANSDKLSLPTGRGIGANKFQMLMALSMNANDPMSYPNQLERLKKKDEELYPRAYLGNYMECPYFDSVFGDEFYSRNTFPYHNTIVINA